MYRIRQSINLLVLSIILWNCSGSTDTVQQTSQKATIFEKIDPDYSNVDFTNKIVENAYFNLFKWKYIYNGAGVATGDINNDGLIDVYLVSNTQPNRLFLNKGNFQFDDITSKAGVSAASGYKTGVSIVDIDGDGLMDIFVCRDADPNPNFRNNLIYYNNGDTTFSQRNAEVELLDQSFTTQALFIDYDNDTDLDIVLINHPEDFDKSLQVRVRRTQEGTPYKVETPTSNYSGLKIYRNDISSFTEVTKELGIDHQSFGLGGVVADFNHDGWLDFFIANDFIEPDFLFINQQGKGFKEEARKYFAHFSQNSMGVNFQDLNNDGYGDLVVLDMLAESNERQKSFATSMSINQYNTWLNNGYGSQIMRNMLQLGSDDGFAEVGMLAGIEKTDWSWAPVLEDFNLDGHLDIFISNGIKKDMSDKDFISYLSDSLSMAKKQGIEALTEKNYKEWLNLIPSTPLQNKLFISEGDLRFIDVKPDSSGLNDSTFSQGVATADFDNDGRMDLIVNNTDQASYLYRNNVEENQNFIKVRLSGPGKNTFGYGSKVVLYGNSGKNQSRFVHANAGYLSSSQPDLIYGLAQGEKIDSIVVIWPGNMQQTFTETYLNTLNILSFNAKSLNSYKQNRRKPFLTDASSKISDPFKHRDSSPDAFKIDPLLLKSFHHRGPALSIADVNKDGLEDFFIGGGPGQSGVIYIQKDGEFINSEQAAFQNDNLSDDVASVFFDLENDGDLDLYVVSGGLRPEKNLYKDRLYVNDGRGNFELRERGFSGLAGSCISAADIDADGDMDLFVGNILTGSDFHALPSSYVLINESGKFTKVTLSVNGYVTSGQWIDYNNDSYLDLIITGYWMSPTLLIQDDKNNFTSLLENTGLENYEGLWNKIEIQDVDNDGDTDLLVGNEGLNIPFEIDEERSLRLYINDFDRNGRNESIITFILNGKEWPYARKETLGKQVPMINKRFTSYSNYSKATIKDIFDEDLLAESRVSMIKEVRSGIFLYENEKYTFKPFDRIAQSSPVFTIEKIDTEDYLLAGNFRYNEVEIGPYDASKGYVWNAETLTSTRLTSDILEGEVRNSGIININDNQYLLVTVNNSDLRLIKLSK